MIPARATYIKRIFSLSQLEKYLSNKKNLSSYSVVSYIWHEYGFLPIYFNELFEEFFDDCADDHVIGICFAGHEIFYEGKVDELLILDGFIDTQRAYKNSKETRLLIEKFNFHENRAIAFWFTIRNFDEDHFQNIIDQCQFKRELFAIGKKTIWANQLFPGPHPKAEFQYARGINNKEYYLPKNITHWQTKKKLGWNLKKWQIHHKLPRVVHGEYDLIFVKNSFKTISNDGKKRFGYVESLFLQKLIEAYTQRKRKLVILHDLVEYTIEANEYIHEVRMMNFFDTKYFLSLVQHARIFISSATSPIDLAAYYCDTNLLLLDDIAFKVAWVGKVLQKRGKRCAACGSRSLIHVDQALQFIDSFEDA